MALENYSGKFESRITENPAVFTHRTLNIESHYLYGISGFKLNPEIFTYGFIPVRTIESNRIFYPLSWDR